MDVYQELRERQREIRWGQRLFVLLLCIDAALAWQVFGGWP